MPLCCVISVYLEGVAMPRPDVMGCEAMVYSLVQMSCATINVPDLEQKVQSICHLRSSFHQSSSVNNVGYSSIFVVAEEICPDLAE